MFRAVALLAPAVAIFAFATGCNRDFAVVEKQPAPAAAAFPVTIHTPPKLTGVPSDHEDALGRPLRVRCVECHSQRQSEEPRRPEQLDEFHRGLTFKHGELACVSCHDRGDHERLTLASGEKVPLVDAMRLCAQCHGPQYRDYTRGSHGGMNGYWDLSRGPRLRNHCVDCHDPHSPAYPGFSPAPGPRDRGAAPHAAVGGKTTHE